MARGREAVRAARQRQAEANAAVDRVRLELTEERERHEGEVKDLRSQITHLKSNIWQKASEMAKAETQHKLEEIAKARHERGLSDDIAIYQMYQKDHLIRNACKYISMTTGHDPAQAIAMVLTWCTDKDIHSLLRDRTEFFIQLGVPTDGWVADSIKRNKRWEKAGSTTTTAISLDHAIETDHPKIHPAYKQYGDKWYPPAEYPELQTTGPDDRKRKGA